jgi:hypothetical protein
MHFVPSTCMILTMSSSRPRWRFFVHEVRSFTLQSPRVFLRSTSVLATIGSDFIKLMNTNKTPHPSVLRKDGKGAYKQVGELARSPRVGPSSGDRRMATPPGHAPNAGECQHVRMAPPRLAETLPMPAKTNTLYTGLLENLAGASTLLQGFGGYTRGCASA